MIMPIRSQKDSDAPPHCSARSCSIDHRWKIRVWEGTTFLKSAPSLGRRVRFHAMQTEQLLGSKRRTTRHTAHPTWRARINLLHLVYLKTEPAARYVQQLWYLASLIHIKLHKPSDSKRAERTYRLSARHATRCRSARQRVGGVALSCSALAFSAVFFSPQGNVCFPAGRVWTISPLTEFGAHLRVRRAKKSRALCLCIDTEM